jgi:hypothetical protein
MALRISSFEGTANLWRPMLAGIVVLGAPTLLIGFVNDENERSTMDAAISDPIPA